MVLWEQIFLLKQSTYWNQKCNNKILWSGFEPCILLFISTALHSWVIQPIEYAGLYVVNLTFRYNYAHLSRSPLSPCFLLALSSYRWRAALTDRGLIFLSTASIATSFQRDLLFPSSRPESKSCWHSLNWLVKATVSAWHSVCITEPVSVSQCWCTFVLSARWKETGH